MAKGHSPPQRIPGSGNINPSPKPGIRRQGAAAARQRGPSLKSREVSNHERAELSTSKDRATGHWSGGRIFGRGRHRRARRAVGADCVGRAAVGEAGAASRKTSRRLPAIRQAFENADEPRPRWVRPKGKPPGKAVFGVSGPSGLRWIFLLESTDLVYPGHLHRFQHFLIAFLRAVGEAF